MIRYLVVIERGDSSWGAHVPDLRGCVAAGKSRDEVVGLIQGAIAMHVDELSKQGLPIPPPASEGTFVELRDSSTAPIAIPRPRKPGEKR